MASHGGRCSLDETQIGKPICEWSWDADDRDVERLKIVLIRRRSVATQESFSEFTVADVTNVASPGPQLRDTLSGDLETHNLVADCCRPYGKWKPDISLPDHRDFGLASFNYPEQVTGHEISGRFESTGECNDKHHPRGFALGSSRPR